MSELFAEYPTTETSATGTRYTPAAAVTADAIVNKGEEYLQVYVRSCVQNDGNGYRMYRRQENGAYYLDLRDKTCSNNNVDEAGGSSGFAGPGWQRVKSIAMAHL